MWQRPLPVRRGPPRIVTIMSAVSFAKDDDDDDEGGGTKEEEEEAEERCSGRGRWW